MRIYSSEPLNYINNRIKLPEKNEANDNENIYENVWLPVGDDKESDIFSLLQQNRIRKY